MKLFTTLTKLGLGSLFAAAFSLPAHAQFQKPEDAVKYRKAVYTVMADQFGRIGAAANGRAPFDAKAVAEQAAVVETMSKLPWVAFGADTKEFNAGPKGPNDAVWTNAAKFKEGADNLQAAAGKLSAAAKTGNLDQVKAAFGATAGTCKACHDNFRKQ